MVKYTYSGKEMFSFRGTKRQKKEYKK